MNHTKLFYEWMKTEYSALKNIKNFIQEQGKITIFTKDDILEFQNTKYQHFLEICLIKDNINYLFNNLTDEEMKQYIRKSKSLKIDLFLETINRLPKTKNLLQMLKKDIIFMGIFNIYYPEIIDKLVEVQDTNFLEYLPQETIILIILNEKDNYKKLILQEVLVSKYYMEEIFKNISTETIECLKELKQSIYYEGLYKKYKKDIFVKLFHNYCVGDFITKINSENYDLFETLILIIEDTARLAKKEIYEVEYLDKGSYSYVYQLGNYVIKIGQKRAQNKIPFDIDMLYPICRKYIKELDLFIEITSLEDSKNIKEEDVYQLFKRKREEGKCWIDAKKENVVRLTKENGSYPFEIEPETLGFYGKKEETKRKQGDCVICDTDLLYYEKNVPWKLLEEICSNIVLDNYIELEKRYQQEKILQRKKD